MVIHSGGLGPREEIAGARVDDWYVAQAAARALGELGDPQAIAPLRRGVGDPRPAVRRAAREALGGARKTTIGGAGGAR